MHSPPSNMGTRAWGNESFRDAALLTIKETLKRWFGLPASLNDLPVPAQLYLMCIWAVSTLMVVWGVREFPRSRESILLASLLVLLFWLMDIFPIKLRPNEAEVTLSVSVGIATIMLLPPHAASLTVFMGTSLGELRAVRPWYKKAFNVAQMVTVYTTLAWVFRQLGGDRPPLLTSAQGIVAVLIVWIAHYVLNIGLVTAVIALALRAPFISVWRANFRDVLYHQIFTAPLGALLAVLIQQQPLGVVLMLAPVYMMHRSMELMSEFRRQTINALLAFANSIDARDPSTYQHSQRVGELAKKIAEQMELPPDEVELIYLSARLHDLGKVAVTDMIFHKPGKLTDQEYRVIQTHPFVGAQIVENFPLFGPGRDLIKYHHERYDGRGYPEGLAHEEIPLGARIIAVADAYDAMTSDRPYRSRLPKHEAIKRIVEERSKQFDPQVVDAFLQVTAQAQAPASEPVTERGQTVSPHVQREAPATACSS